MLLLSCSLGRSFELYPLGGDVDALLAFLRNGPGGGINDGAGSADHQRQNSSALRFPCVHLRLLRDRIFSASHIVYYVRCSDRRSRPVRRSSPASTSPIVRPYLLLLDKGIEPEGLLSGYRCYGSLNFDDQSKLGVQLRSCLYVTNAQTNFVSDHVCLTMRNPHDPSGSEYQAERTTDPVLPSDCMGSRCLIGSW